MRRSLLIAAALLTACAASKTIDPYESERAELVVDRGPLERHVLLAGVLEAADSIDIKVPRTRTWQLSIRWMAEDGANVKKGDRLLEFDNSALTEQLRELELAIVRADIDLAKQRAADAVAVADKELEVEKQRIEVAKAALDANIPRNLVSQREYEDAKIKLERAETAYANAKDDLETARKAARLERDVKQIEYQKAERRYDRAYEQLDALVLKAPRDGVLVIADHPWFGRRLQVGDMVRPGMTAVKVSSVGAMRVVAQLSDVDDGRVLPGMKVVSVLDAYPERQFPGEVAAVSEIARAFSEKSTRRFFKVTVELEKNEDIMRPGMSVRADVTAGADADVLRAPRAGIAVDGQVLRARLASGDEREIEVSFCTARHCAIKSGLSEGDRLRYGDGER